MPFNWNGNNPVDNVEFNGQTADNVIFNGSVVLEGTDDAFISVWRTTTANETLTLPTTNYVTLGWNAVVDWGDGSPTSTLTQRDDPNRVHTYATAGDYTVRITGSFPGIASFNGDISKLIAVYQLGKVSWVNLYSAFGSANNLEYFNSGVCDTSGVTDSPRLFISNSASLDLVDMQTMDLSSADSFRYLFLTARNILNVRMPLAPTTALTNCTELFRYAYNVKTIDLGGLDTSNCTSHAYVFEDTYDLESVDLTKIDTSSSTNFTRMFEYCGRYAPTQVDFSPVANFNIANLTTATQMFNNVTVPTNTYDSILTSWNSQPHQLNVDAHFGNSTYSWKSSADTARQALVADGWTITDGGPNVQSAVDNAIATWSNDTYTNEFAYMLIAETDGEVINAPLFDNGNYTWNAVVDWGDGSSDTVTSAAQLPISHTYTTADVYRVKITGTAPGITAPAGGKALFNIGDTGLKDVFGAFSADTYLDYFEPGNFDTSGVTNWAYTFAENDDPNTRVPLDLTEWDTSSAVSMTYMFENSRSYTSITLPANTTPNLTDASYMFSNCRNLETLDLGGLTTGNVTNATRMFTSLNSVTNLDVTGLDFSSITSADYMFGFHYVPTSFTFPSSPTPNLVSAEGMFSELLNATSIDFGGLDTSNVTNASYMFAAPNSFTTLDLSGLNFSSVVNMEALTWNYYYNTNSLTSVILPASATPNLTNASYMFSTNYNLVSIDLGGLDTTNVTNFLQFLDSANDLESVNLSQIKTDSATNINDMFYAVGINKNVLDWAPIADYNIGNVTSAERFLTGVDIGTTVYDDLLVKWEAQPHQPNVTIDFGTSKYTAGSAAATARAALVADGWTITDGGSV